MKGLKNSPVKKCALFLLCLAVMVIASTLAFASNGGSAEGGITGAMVKDLLLKVINLTIYLSIIIYFIKKPFKNFLISRRDNIEKSMKDADSSLQDALKESSDTKARLSNISQEIAQIEERIRKEGETEKRKIIERAQELAEKIKSQTKETIKRELDLAHRKIKEETFDKAIDAVEEVLKGKFTPADQDKAAQMIAQEIPKIGDIDIFLQNPISAGLRKKVPLEIDTSKNVSSVTMDFIKILLASDDDIKKHINDIKKAYDSYLSEITGTSKTFVYTTTDLSDTALNKITSSLKQAINKDIEIEVVQDPAIIGGIVTKIGSLVFDASVRTQLENMRVNLKKEVI